MKGQAALVASDCKECNHRHYKNNPANCPNCNCGESERIYTGTWRGFNPEAMYNGHGNPYERSDRELNMIDEF
jgi:ribosomal protein L37E